MDVVFDNIYALFVFTVVFLVLYTALLNVYFIHKNGFRVSVNCWFCNKNSKVLYSNRNSFECTFCSQYNGFDQKGDYNRIIEAQYKASLNNSNAGIYQQGLSSNLLTNGLCDRCNRNIQLKVLQLAKYEPLNENNYDAEIEHFEKQLDKTYNLCKGCVKTVKNTIRTQNAWIFGNRLKNLKNKGLSFIKLNKHSQGDLQDRHFFNNFSIIGLILFIISVLNLCSLCGFEIVVFKDILPESALPSHVIFSDIYSTFYNATLHTFGKSDYLRYLPKIIKTKESSSLYISLIGLSLEIVFSLVEKKLTFFGKCNNVFSWIILGLTSSIHFSALVKTYISTLQLFCSFYLLYNYISMCLNLKKRRQKDYKLRHYKTNSEQAENLDDEESDSDSLNNTQVSYRTAINKRSPIASNHNTSLNRTFQSTGFVKTTPSPNTTILKHNLFNPGNTELNKHFHSLNLGAFEPTRPMSCQSFQSAATINPFLNKSRPQSPNSFHFGIAGNNVNPSLSQSYLNRSQNNLFKFQNLTSDGGYNLNSPKQHSAFATATLNNFHNHSSTNNISCNGYMPGSSNIFHHNRTAEGFMPSDTSSVFGGTSKQSSPIYRNNDLNISQKCFKNNLNDSLRPLSPISSSGKSKRSLLSPPKLNHTKLFNSDARENETLNLSFQSEKMTSPNLWPRQNNSFSSVPNYNQSIIVNSLTKVCPSHSLGGAFLIPEKNVSRSSSSSSGFVSTKEHASSLPNSRDHSPDRNSILSEPAFHLS